MNNRSMRAALAAALATVPDCGGFEQRPTIPNAGDAWPVAAGGDHASGDAFTNTWMVRVCVPQDEVAAQDWWDDHWAPLYYALKSIGYIAGWRPIVVPMQGGEMLAYEITLQAEE